MRNILHIFRKDIRHLWPHVAAVLTLILLAGLLDPTFGNAGQSTAYSLLEGLALPLACWSLVIAAIHEEKLIGDRQYWLTRPYSWQQLLAEKALLVFALVNVPLFLWHVSALTVVGIPIWQHLPALLWRQVFFTAFYILPVAAMAVVTKSLGQIILTVLLIVSPTALVQTFLFAHFRIELMNLGPVTFLVVAALVAVGAVSMLLIQYSQRTARLSRLLGIGVLVLGVLFILVVTNLSKGVVRAATNSPFRLSVAPSTGRRGSIPNGSTYSMLTLEIPILLEGVPGGVTLVNRAAAIFVGAHGPRQGTVQAFGNFHDIAGGSGWLSLRTELSTFDQMRRGASVHGTASFLVFGARHDYSLTVGHPVVVPHVGACRDALDVDNAIAVVCYSPDPRASVNVGATSSSLNWIIPPGSANQSIPLSIDMMPLMRYSSMLTYRKPEDLAGAHLMTAEPLPPITVDFNFQNVDWSQYVFVGGKH